MTWPRGYSRKFNTGTLRPKVQSLNILYTIFYRKGALRIPASIDKWYPFHKPSLELCIPFTAVTVVNALAFKYE